MTFKAIRGQVTVRRWPQSLFCWFDGVSAVQLAAGWLPVHKLTLTYHISLWSVDINACTTYAICVLLTFPADNPKVAQLEGTFWGRESDSKMLRIGSMWHCSVDVTYPRLSDTTCLQLALCSL